MAEYDMQNVIISLTPLHDGSENSTDGAEISLKASCGVKSLIL